MMQQVWPPTTGVGKSAQVAAAQVLLFCFTILLALKVDQRISLSWWIIFVPLWLFHSVVSRDQFTLPARTFPDGSHWAPCHAIVAAPLLISFEFLLCIHLQTKNDYSSAAYNLKIVFLPLLAFEVIILIDNFRMFWALDEEAKSEEPISSLAHLLVVGLMVILLLPTILTLLKLCGNVDLSWWKLVFNFGMVEYLAFLISKPTLDPSSSSEDLESGHSLSSFKEEENNYNMFCGLQVIGGHFMKMALISFHILLCMKLEGTPSGPIDIPILVLFSPLFVLEGFGVLFSVSRLIEKLILLLGSGPVSSKYLLVSSKVRDCFAFLHHGSRLLGWWSIDDGSTEEEARLSQAKSTGYNTFCGYPPEVVNKMPKRDLVDEVWRLQAALGEQTEITECTQQEFERLQNEKILCRICYEEEICTVLIPCRHRTLCKVCAAKCEKCPFCRVPIEETMTIFDV